jgi:hypothetical protein
VKYLLIFSLAVVFTEPLCAQVDDMEARNKVTCDAAKAKPFISPALDSNLKPDCDSAAYYFGIGRPIDYAVARRCAYIERMQQSDTASNIFAGPGVLSMLYANGQGVKADLDLATRFTCENSWAAPAELEGRLDILANDRKTGTLARFDLCATATSGMSEGWCASIGSRLNDVKRDAEVQKLTASLSQQAKSALADLQNAEAAFEKLRTGNEVDLTGTGRAAFEFDEQNLLRQQFLNDIKLFNSAHVTQPISFAAADDQLNSAYSRLRTDAKESFKDSTITFAGVQETQRAWLKLRDTWRAYATALGSSLTPDVVATQITRERTHQLRSLDTH